MRIYTICLLIVLALALIVGAQAAETFQNPPYTVTGYRALGATGSVGVYSGSYLDVNTFNSGNGYIDFYPFSTNYLQYNIYPVSSWSFGYPPDVLSMPAVSTPSLVQLYRNNSVINVFVNTTYIGNISCSPTAMTLITMGTGAGGTAVKDFSQTPGDVVSGPPHTWFIAKDLTSPSVQGLFNPAFTNVYTDHIDVEYSSPTPNQTIYVDGCSPVIATGYAGIASINITPLLATSDYGIKNIRFGTATDFINYRAVTLEGTNIVWNKTTYVVDDPATISYNITTQYWDSTLYDYKIKIQRYNSDTTFTNVQTIPIFTSNGSASFTNGTASGNYIAELILDFKSEPNTDYFLATNWSQYMQGVLIWGNTYDGITGSVLEAVTVNITQNSVTNSTSSNAFGFYSVSTLYNTGQDIVWAATKTNYTQANFTYSFGFPGTYRVDMSLLPYNGTSAPIVDGEPIWNGTAIYGLVTAAPSGGAVANATVTCGNGGPNTTVYTSATGYYHFDNLTDNSTYVVGATSSGYGNTPLVSVTTGAANTGTRQDFILTQGYAVAVNVFDSVTLAPINGAYVTVNGGSGQTATGGSTSYNLPYGYYTIAASASSYNPNSVSQAITQGMTINLYLTPISSSSSSNTSVNGSIQQQGYGMSYAPHNVRFSVQTLYGIPIEDVVVTAQGYETTAGSFQWLYDVLGWHSANETPIANTLLNGTTDHLGQINFMMFEPVKYHMTFYKPGVINVTWDFYPKDEYYTVVSGALSNATWYQGSYNMQEVILSNVTAYEDNGTIALRYHDIINSTVNGTIWLNQTNKTNATFPETSLYNFTVPNATLTNASNWSFNFSMVGYKGQSYIVRFRMNSTVFTQQIQRDYGVTFRKEQINPMGLTDFELMLISMFLLIFLGCFFGAVQAPQGPLLVCFCGWILWGIGWMNAVGSAAPATLTLATFISVAVLIFVRSRKGTWF